MGSAAAIHGRANQPHVSKSGPCLWWLFHHATQKLPGHIVYTDSLVCHWIFCKK